VLSRPFAVDRLPDHGADMRIIADEKELKALAQECNLPQLKALSGTFFIKGSRKRVRVTGMVEADVTYLCGITLEPFDAHLREEVDVTFASRSTKPQSLDQELDQPDPIDNNSIDLGALTAEFLVLGLDPYPRKPDANFENPQAEPAHSPFDALKTLQQKK
jgi:uncharacterized metal-binding protein YceD (DUF177 family)